MDTTTKETYAFLKVTAKVATYGMVQLARAPVEWCLTQSATIALTATPQIEQYQMESVYAHLPTTPLAQDAALALLTVYTTLQLKLAFA